VHLEEDTFKSLHSCKEAHPRLDVFPGGTYQKRKKEKKRSPHDLARRRFPRLRPGVGGRLTEKKGGKERKKSRGAPTGKKERKKKGKGAFAYEECAAECSPSCGTIDHPPRRGTTASWSRVPCAPKEHAVETKLKKKKKKKGGGKRGKERRYP